MSQSNTRVSAKLDHRDHMTRSLICQTVLYNLPSALISNYRWSEPLFKN